MVRGGGEGFAPLLTLHFRGDIRVEGGKCTISVYTNQGESSLLLRSPLNLLSDLSSHSFYLVI